MGNDLSKIKLKNSKNRNLSMLDLLAFFFGIIIRSKKYIFVLFLCIPGIAIIFTLFANHVSEFTVPNYEYLKDFVTRDNFASALIVMCLPVSVLLMPITIREFTNSSLFLQMSLHKINKVKVVYSLFIVTAVLLIICMLNDVWVEAALSTDTFYSTVNCGFEIGGFIYTLVMCIFTFAAVAVMLGFFLKTNISILGVGFVFIVAIFLLGGVVVRNYTFINDDGKTDILYYLVHFIPFNYIQADFGTSFTHSSVYQDSVASLNPNGTVFNPRDGHFWYFPYINLDTPEHTAWELWIGLFFPWVFSGGLLAAVHIQMAKNAKRLNAL